MIKNKKPRFVLTLRNKNGQVGIFVALIFQVIFVFFAMLINVGLIVHHKINLQQSTDIAAYYGAMKQAEILNVMAHVNFQIRQAWKLMTWRYRILGTFGLEQTGGNGANDVQFPIMWGNVPPGSKPPAYNSSSDTFSCPSPPLGALGVAGLTVADVPFMCLGHSGFADWIGDAKSTETFCKVDCGKMNGAKISIPTIPTVGGFNFGGANIGSAVAGAINQANKIVADSCASMAPITAQLLALFYENYIKDTQNRKQFIVMLNNDLALPEEKILDLKGEKVIDGVEKTLKNNLTEANRASVQYSTYNGLSSSHVGGGKSMLNEIKFQMLMFFLIGCTNSGGANIGLKSLYDSTGNLDADVFSQLGTLFGAPLQKEVNDIFLQNSSQVNTIGFEKNPWMQTYYGVKAVSQPKIPFLPLAKIRLQAVSFAKPFGGSIGPWYYNKWGSNDSQSNSSNDDDKVDPNLPKTMFTADATLQTLKGARELIMNYSNYVGDTFSNNSPLAGSVGAKKGGLANIELVALYHSMLAKKQTFTSGRDALSSPLAGKPKEPAAGTFQGKPTVWPKYAEWYHLAKEVSEPDYDPLARDDTTAAPKIQNSYSRDLEVSVVSPNQFDVSYYSIEPDFESNYYNDLSKSMGIIASAAGTPTPVFPYDFGNPGTSSLDLGGVINYSVKNQLEVTKKLFKDALSEIVGVPPIPTNYGFNFLATAQASLLSGWTYGVLRDFLSDSAAFPGSNGDQSRFTMLFGTCSDPWSSNAGTPVYLSGSDPSLGSGGLPAMPGNCVTGGRTGYSVKIISADMVKSGKSFNDVGGKGTSGPIANPVDPTFLKF